MPKSLKESIRAIDDIQKRCVLVKEWNNLKIELRSMSGLERAEVLDTTIENGTVSNKKLFPAIIIASCFDPATGEKIFDQSDRDWLMKKSAGAIEFLAQSALDISGLSGSAEEQAEKNSGSL